MKAFDVVRAAGGPRRAIVKKFRVRIATDLVITFTPVKGKPILCGVELVAE